MSQLIKKSAIAMLMDGPMTAPRPPSGAFAVGARVNGLADPDEPGITPKQRANRRAYLKHFAPVRHRKALRRYIDWVSVKDRLPDADMAVLLDYDGEPWPGVYDGAKWFDLTGMPIVAQVLHWAEFPAVP